ENFNNDGQATANAHEYATCLETDSHGNFYYLRGDSGSQTEHDGCLLRVTPDGRKLEVFATGFRNANGLSIGPDDSITVAPQEGNWTPGSAIFQVRQGGFYGAMQSHHRKVAPTDYDRPICWIPRLQDNSSGGQTWVTSDRWGPLQGQLLHFSFGTCRMFLTVREEIEKGVQGGTVQFPLLFDSGVMRGRFRPQDGQLYVAGLKGWVSSAVQDGCLQRVRFTRRPVDFPVKLQTKSNGMTLTFTEPLDAEEAEDPDNFGVEEWNYLWSGNYGSPEMKVSNPGQVGHDEVEVVSATLLPDRKSVFLEMPDLKPAMQVSINYTLTSKTGRPIQQTFNATLHKLGLQPQPEPLTRKARPGQLPLAIERSLRPGLVMKIEAEKGAAVPVRFSEQGVSRLAAYYLPRSSVETVLGPDVPLKATWTGYLKVPQKGEYQFRIETRGKAGLKIGAQDIALNTPVVLRRGYQPFSLIFASQHSEIDVRLLWKSVNSPWEAVPPQLLFHRHDDAELVDAQVLRTGRDLFREHGCANCHASRDAKTEISEQPEWGMTTPNLDQLGGRLNAEWIAAWIQRPHQLRTDAVMPQLFHGKDPLSEKQAVADLMTFLLAGSPTLGTSPPSDAAEDTDAGLQLYESQGCMGCHRFTPPENADPFDRVSLHYVGVKFRRGQMAEFLRNPRRHSPQIRMPDFRFTELEARSLESYVRSMSTGKISELGETIPGDAKRGQQVFQSKGCQNCHIRKVEEKRATAKLPPVWGKSKSTGCLAVEVPVDAAHPRYQFANFDRAALNRYLEKAAFPARPEFDIEQPQRLVKRMNCQGCHSRDGTNSPLAEILSEEGQGLPPEALPQLTWAGEKLRTDWIDRLLHGKLAYQSRPWLKARMPSFPGNHLAAGLTREHGIRFDTLTQSPAAEREQVELGRQLTLKGQGLDCRQCHGVGQEQPAGDRATLISVGINFSVIADRLNPEFFPRLLLNPPRYDANSRMPVFAIDGKTTAAKGILNGDAQRQYEAIWAYLKTLSP
ncbi:MAG: Trehalose utilization, partial [Planctomycetaceae bacterium]|nr:Trehalose utilization [Planctomycetaceae bacterium]